MNRRAFLVRLGAGAAVAATSAGIVGSVLAGAPVGAAGVSGAELVVNGSFEDGVPGATIAGWTVPT